MANGALDLDRRAARPHPRCCPIATCAASARPRCRSCCGWRRCARLLRVAVAAGARLRRRVGRAVHGAAAEGARQGRLRARRGGPLRLRPDAGLPRLRLPADGAAVRALGPLRRALAPARADAHRRLAVPGDDRRARVRASRAATRSPATTSSTARSRSRSSRSRRCAGSHTLVTGWLLARAGYTRRTLLVGSGRHLDAVAHALADSPHGGIEPVGYISLTPRPDNGLRSLGELAELPEILAEHRVQEVIIADPDFPQDAGGRAGRRVPPRGVEVHVAPSTMEILTQRAEFVPGQSLPLFTLKPPVFEGVDFAIKRTFDAIGATLLLVLLSPLLLGDRARGQADLARAGALPLGAAGHGRRAVRLPQVPHDARRRRAGAGGARGAQRDERRAVQDPRRPAHDAGRALPAPLLARRAAAARERRARRDVARRPAPAAAARLRAARGVAQEALPRAARASPGCGRSPAARSSTSTTSCGSTSSTSSAGRSRSTS